ncbi:LysR family transcriptional regulator [Bradyrhizobium manausense]|uniref:LysR family transcriptional regulator n=1 Tax=Bradyrhizobium manausense TaxID=989370 RepID=UPI001BADE87B|nr:LysR family transcriptional regulator [Bradyrhizobium manausense]MBR0687777.1 LysR family transcriptional regulator [Bradyrhizobium manausense]
MTVTLRQLEAFLLVYKLRSITKAAAEMGVTQSAISLLIRQLETDVRVLLFDRTTRALSPTAAAIDAFPVVQRIVGDSLGLTQHLRDLAQTKKGRVVLAVSAGAASALMPKILSKFRRTFPNIEIDLYDVAVDQLVGRILSAEVEFGIGSVEEGNSEIAIEPLLRGQLSAIGLRDRSFERKRQMGWSELSNFSTIAMRRGTRIREQIDRTLAQAGKVLSPTYEVSLINTALSMTAQGLALSILPVHVLPGGQFPSLVAVPLVNPAIHRQLSLVTRAGISLSPAAQKFVTIAKEQLGPQMPTRVAKNH